MHYKDGTEVKVGDVVTITSKVKVTSLYTGSSEEYCNVNILIGAGEDHGPHNVTNQISINTHQIELVERGT